ncbi:hypothetical protein HanHA300_Chr12g0456821 [Helianthus annuus]|nr:hypothetical protein HanHA300_Chr12g0456821 [Helianthus annuus]KAJ0506474.1 hypothetical protein HanHA89_Chr12g0482401 [Helianthus annuus]KAJ0676151.1 hypothetical protein HanLR1_Chr12g0459391 [Helianthus annuus]
MPICFVFFVFFFKSDFKIEYSNTLSKQSDHAAKSNLFSPRICTSSSYATQELTTRIYSFPLEHSRPSFDNNITIVYSFIYVSDNQCSNFKCGG